jgi:hypothetical protein
MQTAENVIDSIHRLPQEEKVKLALHILQHGIMGSIGDDTPEVLNLYEWQSDIAKKPFSLREASGISAFQR